MRKIFAILFLLTVFIAGLNATAMGMHRLLPSSPSCVVDINKKDGGLELILLDYKWDF